MIAQSYIMWWYYIHCVLHCAECVLMKIWIIFTFQQDDITIHESILHNVMSYTVHVQVHEYNNMYMYINNVCWKCSYENIPSRNNNTTCTWIHPIYTKYMYICKYIIMYMCVHYMVECVVMKIFPNDIIIHKSILCIQCTCTCTWMCSYYIPSLTYDIMNPIKCNYMYLFWLLYMYMHLHVWYKVWCISHMIMIYKCKHLMWLWCQIQWDIVCI